MSESISYSLGGVVLCGGKSSRMGMPKATLPFGKETMLERIVRLLQEVVDPIVLVAAPEQDVDPVPVGVKLVRDRRANRGPLEGILAGLSSLTPHVPAAFVTSCDVPMLVPAFVKGLFRQLNNYEIVVPYDGEFHHPLSAIYCTTVVERIQLLLDQNRLRPVFLFDLANTRQVSTEMLREFDPELATLQNLNRPQDYFAALARDGLEAPPEIRARLQSEDQR